MGNWKRLSCTIIALHLYVNGDWQGQEHEAGEIECEYNTIKFSPNITGCCYNNLDNPSFYIPIFTTFQSTLVEHYFFKSIIFFPYLHVNRDWQGLEHEVDEIECE